MILFIPYKSRLLIFSIRAQVNFSGRLVSMIQFTMLQIIKYILLKFIFRKKNILYKLV